VALPLADLRPGRLQRTLPAADRVSLPGVVPNLGRLQPTSSRAAAAGIVPLRRAMAEVMELLVRRGPAIKVQGTLNSRKTTTTRHITKGNTRNSRPTNPLKFEPEKLTSSSVPIPLSNDQKQNPLNPHTREMISFLLT